MKSIWDKHNANLVLVGLLLIFVSYTLFMAINLKPGLIPDEPAHFVFSKHFATTIGIPPDTEETFSWGWIIEQHPFLYYWISGRIINLIDLINPGITDSQLLIVLRVFSAAYATGTVIFCFLLSKEVIQHKWWQLLPVFLLTNTLMFVFVSAGVHYDNLANLLGMAGLYFLVRVFKQRDFLINSLAWMINIALSTLVKYPMLPLALAMSVSWFVYLILHRKDLFPLKIQNLKTMILLLLLMALLVGNFLIYGINLIKYQSITPRCREILLESQCEISRYVKRHQEMALDTRLTISESISQGYPSPIRYVFIDWVYHILLRTFGISGHQAYFQYQLINYFRLLFYATVLLGLLNLFFWRSFSKIDIHLLGIAAFYALVLLIRDYDSELVYGFRQVAVQGRYLFPVIGAICLLFTKIIKQTPIQLIQILMLIVTIGLMFLGGPITILLKYQSVFATWFL